MSAAEGRVVSFEEHEAINTSEGSNEPQEKDPASEVQEKATESVPTPSMGGDLESTVLEIIAQHAGAEGIDYDSIMKHCAQRGFTDEDTIEDTIYGLRDDKCEIMEPRFGWFKPM